MDAVIEEMIPALDSVGFPNTCSPLPIELPATGTPPVVQFMMIQLQFS